MNYKIFVINLNTANDRLTLIQQNFKQLGLSFERIEAVNGSQLSEQQIQASSPPNIVKKNYFRKLGKGEVGCALSHRKAWKKIIDDNLDFAIILEDDVELKDNFSDLVTSIQLLDNNKWHYLKLWNLPKKKTVKTIPGEKLNAFQLVRYSKIPLGMVAQAVSQVGAKQLLNNMPYITRPIDSALKDWWQLKIYPFGITPYAVTLRNSKSCINPHQELEQLKQNRYTKARINIQRAINRITSKQGLINAFESLSNSIKA